jgi:hypothetical protein
MHERVHTHIHTYQFNSKTQSHDNSLTQLLLVCVCVCVCVRARVYIYSHRTKCIRPGKLVPGICPPLLKTVRHNGSEWIRPAQGKY